MVAKVWPRYGIVIAAAVAGVQSHPSPVKGSEPSTGTVSLTLAGDLIGPYEARSGIEQDQAIQTVAKLFQQSDVGIANQEGSIFDAGPGDTAASENGGGYPLATAATARMLRGLGVNLVSKANNHATDYGTNGLLSSLSALDAAGIAHAGAARDLEQACAPTYVKTANGLVAMVSAATTFTPMAPALPPVTRQGVSLARPGICAIRIRSVELVSPGQLASLRGNSGSAALPVPGSQDVRIGDQIFRASSKQGQIIEVDQRDVERVLNAVRMAKLRGAVVLFTVHSHETSGNVDPMPPQDFEPLILHRANEAPSPEDLAPAAFQPGLIRSVIDAGADVVTRTGPHTAHGVELYKGRPIFWSMGSLFLGFGGRRSLPLANGQTLEIPETWFQSIVAKIEFKDGRLTRLEVRPLVLESSKMPSDGQPSLAKGKDQLTILKRFMDQSAKLGTTFRVQGGVAIHDVR